jgi:hypothetical protein
MLIEWERPALCECADIINEDGSVVSMRRGKVKKKAKKGEERQMKKPEEIW